MVLQYLFQSLNCVILVFTASVRENAAAVIGSVSVAVIFTIITTLIFIVLAVLGVRKYKNNCSTTLQRRYGI